MTFALHIVWYQVLLGLIALGLLFLVFMVISAFCVRIDIRDIPSRKEQNNSSRTITIGFFSDTHGFGCLRSPKWIAGAFRKYNCDLVLFGGDCVHKRTVRNSDRKILSEVSSLLKQNGKTLYAVYGNHDWKLTAEDFSSMGAVLLSAGTKGKRYALPNAEIMIHQPLGGFKGQASDIKITADHILNIKSKLNGILADATGQDLSVIESDTDRDNYMSSAEAAEYGLIDKVIAKR